MESGVQLGLGRGPVKSGPNVPTPRVPSIPRHARWLILAHCVFVLYPTLLWAAKGDLFPHIEGAESHRARRPSKQLGLWPLSFIQRFDKSWSIASIPSLHWIYLDLATWCHGRNKRRIWWSLVIEPFWFVWFDDLLSKKYWSLIILCVHDYKMYTNYIVFALMTVEWQFNDLD